MAEATLAAEQQSASPEAVFHDRARLAEAAGNWVEAELNWRQFIAINPNVGWAYGGLAVALARQDRMADAEAILLSAQQRAPNGIDAFVEHARLADTRQDWAQALERWELVRTRFPDEYAGYGGMAGALRHLGRFDDVRPVLQAVRFRFDNEFLSHDLARLAEADSDWSEAEACWRHFIALNPNIEWAYRGLANALARLSRVPEAEDVLVAAQQRLPRELSLFVEHARLAEARADWTEALARWQAVSARFPDQEAGNHGVAHAQRQANPADTVEPVTQDIERQPADDRSLHDLARSADARQDWAQSLALWDGVKAAFPRDPAPYIPVFRALTALGHHDMAGRWLDEGVLRFPDDRDIFAAWAEWPGHNGDWAEAGLRWAGYRAHFPDDAGGAIAGTYAYLRAGLFDEAEEAAAAARESHPSNYDIQMVWAQAATGRRDLETAIARFEDIRERFPGHLETYTIPADLSIEISRFADAEPLIRSAMALFPDRPTPWVQQAVLAGAMNDPDAELRSLAELRLRFPTEKIGYVRSVDVLLRFRRFEEAEAIAREGMARLPDVWDTMFKYAEVAARQERQAEALERFAAMRQRFPSVPAGYIGAGNVLMHQRNYEDAQILLADGVAVLPDDAELAIHHTLAVAWHIVRQGNGSGDVGRPARQLAARFPNYWRAHLVAVQILTWREVWDLVEADRLIRHAFQKWPHEVHIATEYVRSAERLEQPEEMVRRARQIQPLFGFQPEVYVVVARALANAGQLDDADALLSGAADRFPAHTEFHTEYSSLATQRGDLQEAMRRWMDTQRRFPFDHVIAQRLMAARMALLETDPNTAVGAESAIAAPDADNAAGAGTEVDLRTMALQFESFGGDAVGCEFGLFQRRCGAEPLGLMRWSNVHFAELIQCLDRRFEGIGLPEYTKLESKNYDGSMEYEIKDSRFGMAMRTFVNITEVPYEKMYSPICRRLRFLAKELVKNMESGSKIFVYRLATSELNADELDVLYTVMRRYGENWLLYVRYEDAEHPEGTVEIVRPGLMIGYIHHFFARRDSSLGPDNIPGWEAICRAAYRLWINARDGAAPTPGQAMPQV